MTFSGLSNGGAMPGAPPRGALVRLKADPEKVGREGRRNDYGIPAQPGGWACFGGSDTGKCACHARLFTYRASSRCRCGAAHCRSLFFATDAPRGHAAAHRARRQQDQAARRGGRRSAGRTQNDGAGTEDGAGTTFAVLDTGTKDGKAQACQSDKVIGGGNAAKCGGNLDF